MFSLVRPQEGIQRRTYVWNMLSSVLYSLQSALFLLIATRVSGKEAAGHFILLFTVAQTLNVVGNYNIRDFQASDVSEEYGFPDYLTTRVLTCTTMLALAGGYCLYKWLDARAAAILICLVLYRLVEGMEDVFHGAVQRAGRLDVAAICMTSRIALSSVCFCAIYIVTRNQLAASVALAGVCAAAAALLLGNIRPSFRDQTPIRFSVRRIPRLLRDCFPLFIGAFLYTYLINVPKYAIADLMNAEMQTIFNILFMPAFVINILSMVIFKPLTVRMSLEWNDGEYRRFAMGVAKQSVLVLGLTALIIVGGDLIGRHLLAWLYGVDLTEYRGVFALLLLSGGFMAMSYFANMVLIIIRAQFYTIVSYLCALAISMLVTRPMIQHSGIAGAALAYGIICVTQTLIGYGVVLWKIAVRRKTARM